jgi:phosphatidylglycerophosphatase A
MKHIVNHVGRFLATCCYIGYAPYCPGTVASALTVILWYFLPDMSMITQVIFLGLAFPVAVWSAGLVEQQERVHDPSCAVIDEFIGMGVTLFAIPKIWWLYLIAFILFRIFDIAKPFPIRRVEVLFCGGMGIVLDDCVAGIFARILLGFVIVYMGL